MASRVTRILTIALCICCFHYQADASPDYWRLYKRSGTSDQLMAHYLAVGRGGTGRTDREQALRLWKDVNYHATLVKNIRRLMEMSERGQL